MALKKVAGIVGTIGLTTILNNPDLVRIINSQKIIQPNIVEQDLVQEKIIPPYVIEEDIKEKLSEKKKHFYDVKQAFNDSELVFKGKCIDVTMAYCGAVGDVCASYVFETDIFYKLHGTEDLRRLKDKISLFSDVRSLDDSVSRLDRAVMQNGVNGGIYEPSATGIMPGDILIILADLNNGEYFAKYFLNNTKKNDRLLEEILESRQKK